MPVSLDLKELTPKSEAIQKASLSLLLLALGLLLGENIIAILAGAALSKTALSGNAYAELLALEVVSFIVIAGVFSLFALWRVAGFVRAKGWMWLAWSAPLWLYSLSFLFIPDAFQNTSATLLGVILIIAFLVAITEEGMFRGVLWAAFRPYGIWPVVIITSVLFGALHLVSYFLGAPLIVAVSRAIYAFGGGFIFGAVRLRSGSIWPCIALHAFVDAAYFSAVGFDLFQTEGPVDQASLLPVMIGFLWAPGAVFGLWGVFAVHRIAKRRQKTAQAPFS